MKNYKERLENLLFEAYGTRDVSKIPLATFDERDKIDFSKIRGSVRLMNEKVMTSKEVDTYRKKVLQLELP